MNRFIIYIVLSFFFMFSCKNASDTKEFMFLSNSIEQISVSKDFEWLVILPGTGCHGCIQEGEYFMKQNIDDKKILFVLTKTSSLKILQQKIEVKLSEHSNVYIDRENIFDIPTKNAIYPCLVKLENGRIAKIEFQSPDNAAFHNMKKK